MYFSMKDKKESSITVKPIKDDRNLAKEQEESLAVFDKLKAENKEIRYVALRRTLRTTSNESKEAIKELSVKDNFLINPKDRFLNETVVSLASKNPSKTKIRKLFDKMNFIIRRIALYEDFKPEELYNQFPLLKEVEKEEMNPFIFEDNLITIIPLFKTEDMVSKTRDYVLSKALEKNRNNVLKAFDRQYLAFKMDKIRSNIGIHII